MKKISLIIGLILHFFIISSLQGQPYNLDKEIKPVELVLQNDPNAKGSKIVITNGEIQNNDHYFHVSGHDLFEFIEVLIFSNYGSPRFKAEVVKENWEDVRHSDESHTATDGIIHFKFRTYGPFGIHIYAGDERINYTVLVRTSPEYKEYLGNAFVDIQETPYAKNSSKATSDQLNNPKNTNDSSMNWLYIALGAALLIIALLAGVLIGKKGSTTVLIIFALSTLGLAQQHDGNTWHDTDSYGEYLDQQARENRDGLWEDVDQVEQGRRRWNNANKRVGALKDRFRIVEAFYNSHEGLASCISSTPPANMPSMPTFCATDECAACFINARRKFEDNRYTFEKLKTIYDCTKSYSDRAIALGDNMSGVHGVSGIVWQQEKFKIEKTVIDMQKAYDKMFGTLLKEQLEILEELNKCENEHGIPDWFDRFGKLYFDFTKLHYQRKH